MITWIPVHITYTARVLNETITVNRNIFAFTVNISHLGAAINPFLYAYRMRDIRKAIFRLLKIGGKTSTTSDSNQYSSQKLEQSSQ